MPYLRLSRAWLLLAILGAAEYAVTRPLCGQVPLSGDPAQIHQNLKQMARDFVSTDSSVLQRPELILAQGEKRIYYNLGRILPGRLGLDEKDPYSVPFEAQIRIEALRQVLDTAHVARDELSAALDQADASVLRLISEIVAVYRTSEDSLGWTAMRERQQSGIDAQFSAMQNVIVQFATANGMRAQRVSRGLASDYFSVRVFTTPRGGTVRVLPYLEYRKMLILGYPEDQLPWRTLAQNVEDMIGRYRYVVSWPAGNSDKGEFQVRNASDIRLPRQ